MMSNKVKDNWLHLDFKGMMPDLERMLEWVDFFAECGFSGIIWEVDERLPWKTWPGTFRPGYDLDQWKAIWSRSRKRGLQNMPLIQTHGHLEWLLKHDNMACWRENGHLNELCPQHQDVLPALARWLDEIREYHPDANYLHVGGDETWNLATCPICRTKAHNHPNGRLAVYLEHLQKITALAVERGFRPLVWADMFWREKRMDLISELPSQVILVDWQYRGAPRETVARLREGPCKVWGASAVRCVFDLSFSQALLTERKQNIEAWKKYSPPPDGLIHTTWGRGSSLWPPYGPWESLAPLFLYSGNAENPESAAFLNLMPLMDKAMVGEKPEIDQIKKQLKELSVEHPILKQCRTWWLLALDHRQLYLNALKFSFGIQRLNITSSKLDRDFDFTEYHLGECTATLEAIAKWEKEVLSFCEENSWSDADEFVQTRSLPLINLLEQANS